jgi:hypothetical protein
MANDSRPQGLVPIVEPYGSSRIGIYTVETGQNLFRGMVVALNNSGRVDICSAAVNTPALGVIVGFLDTSRAGLPTGLTSLSQGAYLPSGNNALALVTDDPDQLYLVEEDTGGSALTSSAIGNGIPFTYLATSGNTTTGYANLVLNRGSVGTGTDGLLQLVDIEDIKNFDGTDNSPGNYCKWIVRIRNHQFAQAKVSVAI